MKYITTSTHPELKKGIILDHLQNSNHCINHDGTVELHFWSMQVEKGYIKEVKEEEEFTEYDMIEFAKFAKSYNSDNNVRIAFDNWVKLC